MGDIVFGNLTTTDIDWNSIGAPLTPPGSVGAPSMSTYTTYTTAPSPNWALNNVTTPVIAGQISATDVIIDKQSLKEFMAMVSRRLCILVPDPAKLERYQALQQAYEHYLTLERLLEQEESSNG
jgi:hypothetical protein